MTRVDALIVVGLVLLALAVRYPYIDPPVNGEEVAWLGNLPLWDEIVGPESARNPPLYRVVVSAIGGLSHTIALGRGLGIAASLLCVLAIYLAGRAIDPSGAASVAAALFAIFSEVHVVEFALYRANMLGCALLTLHAWSALLFVSGRETRASRVTRWASAFLLPQLHYLLAAPLLGIALAAAITTRSGRALGPAIGGCVLVVPLLFVVMNAEPGWLPPQMGGIDELMLGSVQMGLGAPVLLAGAGLLLSKGAQRPMVAVLAAGWLAFMSAGCLAMVIAPPVRATLGAMSIGLTSLALAVGAVAIGREAQRLWGTHAAWLAIGPAYAIAVTLGARVEAFYPPPFVGSVAARARDVARAPRDSSRPLVITPEGDAMLVFFHFDPARWTGEHCGEGRCLEHDGASYRTRPPDRGPYDLVLLDHRDPAPLECGTEGELGGARLFRCAGH